MTCSGKNEFGRRVSEAQVFGGVGGDARHWIRRHIDATCDSEAIVDDPVVTVTFLYATKQYYVGWAVDAVVIRAGG